MVPLSLVSVGFRCAYSVVRHTTGAGLFSKFFNLRSPSSSLTIWFSHAKLLKEGTQYSFTAVGTFAGILENSKTLSAFIFFHGHVPDSSSTLTMGIAALATTSTVQAVHSVEAFCTGFCGEKQQ